jgi:hypothetical protein
MANPVRRLIELPGVRALEDKALMNTRYAEADAADEFPEIDECLSANFGLTSAEAHAAPRPAGWDNIETRPIAQQLFPLEDAGWDISDDRRRPLRTMVHFAAPLWLAIRGVAGRLPYAAEPDEAETLQAKLAADAARFRRDRR